VPQGFAEVIPAVPDGANDWYVTEPILRATLAAENVSGIDFLNSGCTRNGVEVPLTEYDFYPPNVLEIVVHDDGIFEYECTIVTPAGVSNTESATVMIDKQAYTYDLVETPEPNENGWHAAGPVT